MENVEKNCVKIEFLIGFHILRSKLDACGDGKLRGREG